MEQVGNGLEAVGQYLDGEEDVADLQSITSRIVHAPGRIVGHQYGDDADV